MTDPTGIADSDTIGLATVRATLRAVFAAGDASTDAELWALAGELVDRPRLTRADVEEWLAWRARDHAPDKAGTAAASHPSRRGSV